MEKNILVIGLGLIGGSIALAIKKGHPECKIFGFDVNEEQARLAKSLTVIDEITVSLELIAPVCDYIFISTPVQQTEQIIEELTLYNLKKEVVVTDVGSTKQQIVQKAKALTTKEITFIGGHPMAGSHKSGVAAAKSHLFENAFYIFTPTSHTDIHKIEDMKQLLKAAKAKIITMTAEDHDRIAGVVSHFPHIIAAGLVHQAEDYQNQNELISRLAAGGFRDITRIASSNPLMWRDILLHNKDTLLEIFDNWFLEMSKIRSYVANGNSDEIYNYFETAKSFRDGLPNRTKGAIPSFYDLYVDVPDYPGVISEITGNLAEERISITNIRIIETREEINGVLRISFQSEEDREKAKECIELKANYETYYG